MATKPRPITARGVPRLPTDQMKLAANLRRTKGMTDAQIADVLGCTREWACKLRREYRRRADRLVGLCSGGGDCSLLPALLA